MNCPFCGSNQIMVANSRPTMAASQIWRRRKCLACKGIFTTYERINLSHMMVIKKTGRKQKYNRAKLYSSIYHSSLDKKNADRGDISELSEKRLKQIEQEIVRLKKKEIRSTEITEIALKVLREKAPASFLRFLAYREGDNKRKVSQLAKKYPID